MEQKEPQPVLEKPQPKTTESHPWKRYGQLLAVMLLAGGMALSGSYVMGRIDAPGSSAPGGVVADTVGQGDKLSDDQRVRIEASFMRYTGELQPLAMENKELREQLLEAPYLTPQMRSQIAADVESGTSEVTSIVLWDNFDQDGDIVQVTTGEVSITVPLTHAMQTISIPYKPGQSLVITGIRDGGGGITAAISTHSGEAPLPVMAVGQSIEIPLL